MTWGARPICAQREDSGREKIAVDKLVTVTSCMVDWYNVQGGISNGMETKATDICAALDEYSPCPMHALGSYLMQGVKRDKP